MKDEIKEILDILQKCKDYDDEVYLIKQHGATLLLDYITNLQEENERLNTILNNTHNYIEKMSYCDIVDNPKKELSKILKKGE